MPNWKVIGFHSHKPIEWRPTDSIHCRIKGIPDFKYISNRMYDICYDNVNASTTQQSKYIIVTIDSYILLHLCFMIFVFSLFNLFAYNCLQKIMFIL